MKKNFFSMGTVTLLLSMVLGFVLGLSACRDNYSVMNTDKGHDGKNTLRGMDIAGNDVKTISDDSEYTIEVQRVFDFDWIAPSNRSFGNSAVEAGIVPANPEDRSLWSEASLRYRHFNQYLLPDDCQLFAIHSKDGKHYVVPLNFEMDVTNKSLLDKGIKKVNGHIAVIDSKNIIGYELSSPVLNDISGWGFFVKYPKGKYNVRMGFSIVRDDASQEWRHGSSSYPCRNGRDEGLSDNDFDVYQISGFDAPYKQFKVFCLVEDANAPAYAADAEKRIPAVEITKEDPLHGKISFAYDRQEYVKVGDEVYVELKPDEGYSMKSLSMEKMMSGKKNTLTKNDVTIDSKSKVASTSFIAEEDTNITGEVETKLMTEIKVGEHTNGNLRFTVGDKVYVNEGFVVERGTPVTVEAIVINPKDYYFNGFEIKSSSDSKSRKENPHTLKTEYEYYEINGLFPPIPSLKYQVDIQPSTNGVVQLSESGLVDKDSEVEVYATANAGYKVGGIYVNGKLIDGSSFKVKANSRVKVVFNKIK